jgi:N-acetyl-alpha-D-muramate 1-phosphate uridylyltransferase
LLQPVERVKGTAATMKAMILAAGRGERMRPLTDTVPKPLLVAGGKPLIAWHIDRLIAAGFREIVVNTAHLGEKIEQALRERYGALAENAHGKGVSIAYSREGKQASDALETAGGIAHALPLLGAEPFLVVNGDVFCDYPFARAYTLAQQLRASAQAAWLVMVENPAHHPNGDFGVRSGSLVAAAPAFTYSGIAVFAPSFFADVPARTAMKLRPLLEGGIAQRNIGAEIWRGTWEDIGSPDRLAALDRRLTAAPSTLHVPPSPT